MELQTTHKDALLRLIENKISQKKIKTQLIKFSANKYEAQKEIEKGMEHLTWMNIKNTESIVMMLLILR